MRSQWDLTWTWLQRPYWNVFQLHHREKENVLSDALPQLLPLKTLIVQEDIQQLKHIQWKHAGKVVLRCGHIHCQGEINLKANANMAVLR